MEVFNEEPIRTDTFSPDKEVSVQNESEHQPVEGLKEVFSAVEPISENPWKSNSWRKCATDTRIGNQQQQFASE